MMPDETLHYGVRELRVSDILTVDDRICNNHRWEVTRLDAVAKLVEDDILLLLRCQHPRLGMDEVVPYVSDAGPEEFIRFADDAVVDRVCWQVDGQVNIFEDDLLLNNLFLKDVLLVL